MIHIRYVAVKGVFHNQTFPGLLKNFYEQTFTDFPFLKDLNLLFLDCEFAQFLGTA